MKIKIILTLCIIALAMVLITCDNSPKPGNVKLKNYTDSLSYALGFIYGLDFNQAPFEFNYKMIFKGLINAQDMDLEVLSEDEIMALISRFQNDLSENFEKEQEANLLQNLADGDKFISDYAKNPDVKKTDSGLHYRIISSGKGRHARECTEVQVHFTGKFITGEVFSTSLSNNEPLSINLDGIIPGWSEGIRLMREGDIYEFVLPSHLAYGEDGIDIIEPGMYLIFETDLIKVLN